MPPQRGGTQTNLLAKLVGKPASSDPRRMPLPRVTLRSREREGKGMRRGSDVRSGEPAVALRSVVGEDRLHARETAGGGGAHKTPRLKSRASPQCLPARPLHDAQTTSSQSAGRRCAKTRHSKMPIPMTPGILSSRISEHKRPIRLPAANQRRPRSICDKSCTTCTPQTAAGTQR